MKVYKEYNKTNVSWLTELPCNWNVAKLREIFFERRVKVSDKEYSALSVSKHGIVPQLETAVKTENGDNRKLVKKGDFVINSRSDRKGSSGISQYDGSVSLICLTLEERTNHNKNFLHYLLRSVPFTEEFYRNGKGLVSDLWTTKWDEMKNIFIPIPPASEQEHIVRFLDWKISRINHFINAKKREIRLLEELLIYKIDGIITRGIKNTPLKESGRPWIGSIPKNWKIVKIKRLFSEDDKKNSDLKYRLLSFSRKKGLVYYDTMQNKQSAAEDLSKYRVVKKNQLLENRMQAWSGMFICVDKEGCVSPDYSVFNAIGNKINVKFYEYVFRNQRWIRKFADASRGIGDGFNRLYTPQFGRIEAVFPPKEEQDEIVSYLDAYVTKVDVLKNKIEHEIAHIEEYKTKLIADVVTGQIDVRDVVIPDYQSEEVNEFADEEQDFVEGDES